MRKFIKAFCWVVFVLSGTLALLEVSYRDYWIDFYEAEFNALNQELSFLEDRKSKVLFFGDSFTANNSSYVGQLRSRVDAHIINSAVSGTGALEMSFMAPKRIKEFDPDVVVYQIYLGNDLIDITHRPTGEISRVRQVYHGFSDRIRVIKFLNYRLGQVKAFFRKDKLTVNQLEDEDDFSVERYSSRQKMLFSEEPRLIENTIELKNRRQSDFERVVTALEGLRQELPLETKLFILVIPHCQQVSKVYNERMIALGSKSKFNLENVFVQTLEERLPSATIIDVLPEFKKSEAVGNALYYATDPHLSAIGQTELAQIVEKQLKSVLVEPKN